MTNLFFILQLQSTSTFLFLYQRFAPFWESFIHDTFKECILNLHKHGNYLSRHYHSERYKCTGPCPGLRLGTPMLRKCWIRLYKRYTVIHLNRLELQTQVYTRSLIQHFLLKLNVWERVDPFALKILNSWCSFPSVLL